MQMKNSVIVVHDQSVLFCPKEEVYSGIYRSDKPTYPVFNSILKGMKSRFWIPETINMDVDAVNFNKELPEEAKKIFTENLLWQVIADDSQDKTLNSILECTNNIEVKAAIQWQAMEELNHNHSYQYIINSMYSDPTSMLDEVSSNTEINKRLNGLLTLSRYHNPYITMLGLEALSFTTSFLTTLGLNTQFNSKLSSSKVQIQKIAADEAGHVVLWSNIVKLLLEKGYINESIISNTLDSIIRIEMNWVEYLYNVYPLPQLNPINVNSLLVYKANLITKGLGITIMELNKPSLYEWYQRTININNTLPELQATDTGAYVTDVLVNDWD
jgi:ribonucleotide reductase beta subunit family protein with ferritin-like domain